MDLKAISQQVEQAIKDLINISQVSPGEIIVVGCSTSEVIGSEIGTASSLDAATAIFNTITEQCQKKGLYVAIQCCEHLNRALVVEKELLKQYGLEEVSVMPARKAGGALAEIAMQTFKNPIVVEHIKAHAGIDIGDTFIGMHLRHVAVPVRSAVKSIGQAHLSMARTRPKLIGGSRAAYSCE
jgi:uncharacterized protein (TIGR01440 family)